jgi:predicted Fe-Mo cluster-binding NifX family protein
MLICVPIQADGQVDPRWGRAARVAIVETSEGALTAWREFDVGWNELHDQGTEGGHHARVARFLKDHGVEMVVAHHVGPAMMTMLDRMGLAVRLGASGDARQAVSRAARARSLDHLVEDPDQGG